MNIHREKIRYPKKDDKFFIEKGNQDELAILDKAFQEFGNYADSYQTGALSLINEALSNVDLRRFSCLSRNLFNSALHQSVN